MWGKALQQYKDFPDLHKNSDSLCYIKSMGAWSGFDHRSGLFGFRSLIYFWRHSVMNKRVCLISTVLTLVLLGSAVAQLEDANTLTINMIAPGHWHATWPKILNFTLTDEMGNPVAGLSPTVTVKSMAGTVTAISAKDKGDGTYSATYRPWDIGSGHSMAYNISFRVQYNGMEYFDAWPVKVQRSGNESIIVTVDDTLYAYEVLYGWDPGTIYASDTDLVNMYFEPLRAVQEGNRLNRFQLFLNTYNHLTDLEPTILLESQDGLVSEMLVPTYIGLGVYRAQRVFSVAEVGASNRYTVSFLFTDPYNGYSIEPEKTAFSLAVSAPEEDTTFDPNTSLSELMEGKLIFESSCAACHELPTAEEFKAFPTDDDLIALVNDMTEAAGLSEDDAEKVVLYTIALRHDMLVAAVRELSRPRTVATLAGFLGIGVFIPARRWWRKRSDA